MNSKLIMTIDLDAFFASCEELRHPEIVGKPMVVGFELNGRGVASTANYAARELGAKSGKPLFKLRELIPNLIVITPDHEHYQQKANDVFEIIMQFSNKIEIASIDECFVDLTNMTDKYKPLEIANIIKTKIKNKTGLIVSIGISTDLMLSKIASSMDKPNGITTLWKHEIKDKLWNLSLNRLHMLGVKTVEKFNNFDINTIGQLATLKENDHLYKKIRKELGVNVDKLILEANGESNREIDAEGSHLKSISREETFGVSLISFEKIIKETKKLMEYTFNRLNARKLNASNVQTFIKLDKSFKKISGSKKIKRSSNDWDSIWTTTYNLMNELFIEGMSIKQVGVGLGGLRESERTYKQLTLEETNYQTNDDKLQSIIDDISFATKSDVFLGETMLNNRRYVKGRPLDRDKVKFKVWKD